MAQYAPTVSLKRGIGYLGAIGAALVLGLYVRWAVGFYGIDWALYSSAWRTLFSSHAVHGFGVDYESLYSPRPGGLHLYTSRPDIHMGPLSLLYGIEAPYRWAVHLEQFSQVALGALAGRYLWKTLAARGQQGLVAGVLIAALAFPWLDAGVRYGHPDVTGAVLMALVGARAIGTRRWSLLGFAFGIGCGFSMTMLLFSPMLFLAPSGRERRRVLALAAGVGLVCWLPFIVADPATLLHMSAPDGATHDSLLGAVLHHSANRRHEDARLLQAAACLIIGFFSYRRRGAATALVCVGLVRVALDESTYSYMLLLLVAAGVIADVLRAREAPLVPVSTLSCLLVVVAPLAGDGDDLARSILRSVAVAVALAFELAPNSALRFPRPVRAPKRAMATALEHR
jgi:hypothetical protein